MKSATLTFFSVITLIVSWIVYATTIFMYLILPLGHNIETGIVPTTRIWLQWLRSFYDQHFYLFVFLFFLVSFIVFVSMLRRGKDIAIYKIFFFSAVLNFLFGAVGLFFKFAGHGQEIDGFEWITVFGTFGSLLVIWYMQATLLFLKTKTSEPNL